MDPHIRARAGLFGFDYEGLSLSSRAVEGRLRNAPAGAGDSGRIEAWRNEQMEKRHVSNPLRKQVGVGVARDLELARQPRYGYGSNPTDEIPKLTERPPAALDFYSPEEVWALVRAAKDEQDGALFLTAAFSGLRRGELIALRWRDVDFCRALAPRLGLATPQALSACRSGARFDPSRWSMTSRPCSQSSASVTRARATMT